jgi:nitrogen-specific signal transduction histidine kinase/ActR/RegA family two-component response regulator
LDSHLSLIRDEAGRPKSILGISTDISERVAIEERLRQAERLDAVGQLTGGVAHDFNNLLTVILGNAGILVEELTDREDLRALAEMVKGAAERGAALTSRLLAFARSQALEPRSTDLHQLLLDMHALLLRTLRKDIQLVLIEGSAVWHPLVDPAQLENAVLNLCLNARDAMPQGGRLAIETANITLDQSYVDGRIEVTPGEYVMVAVTDNGAGIAPEHRDRVFDPFFTTKEFGKGTGLGLSMVYGFIKQSRGHIAIYSEPGRGTTVKMYLPRTTDTPAVADEASAVLEELGGSETILLVEDNEMVRQSVERHLTSLGYRVISAPTGFEGLEVIKSGVPIGLLFTDVIMPGGFDGPTLARAARAIRPALRVLYTSGYTESAIFDQEELEGGIQLLNKPYARAELARKVRAALAETPR